MAEPLSNFFKPLSFVFTQGIIVAESPSTKRFIPFSKAKVSASMASPTLVRFKNAHTNVRRWFVRIVSLWSVYSVFVLNSLFILSSLFDEIRMYWNHFLNRWSRNKNRLLNRQICNEIVLKLSFRQMKSQWNCLLNR